MIYFFIIIATVIQLLIIGFYFFIYSLTIKYLVITNQTLILILRLVFCLSACSFLPLSILVNRYDHVILRMAYAISSTIQGLAFILFFLFLALWMISLLGIKVKLLVPFIFIAAFLLLVYGLVNAGSIKINTLNFKLPNLPVAWQNRKIVWISDLHLGPIHNQPFAQKIASQIKAINPDLVIIGGDLYDGTAGDFIKLVQPLGEIKAPLGVYFITGNHEEFGAPDKYLEAISQAGIIDFDNRKVEIDGLQLVGVDFFASRYAKNFSAILTDLALDKNKPSVLFKHEPSNIAQAEANGIDLFLAGHTHSGQMWPVIYITNLVYKGFGSGIKQFKNMSVYISSGTGTWGPPLRLGNRPEIAVITFK